MFSQHFLLFLRRRDDPRPQPSKLAAAIEADNPFPQLRYYALGRDLEETRLTNRLFSRTVSGLDLATTPYALRCAAEHTESIELNSPQNFAILSSSSRRAFPEFYQPFPSSWLYPKLRMSVIAYEQRILRDIVLSTSQSRSIIFDSEGGIIRPHWYWWEQGRFRIRHSVDSVPWFEALDLRGTINVSFETPEPRFHDLPFKPITIHSTKRLEDCTHRVVEGRWLYSLGTQRDLNGRERRSRRFANFVAVLLFPVVSPMGATLYFFCLNSISGGALLSRIISYYPFRLLADAVHVTDNRLCGAVVTGAAPCVFSANPDIAGVGGRVAFYVQAITLITLLTFSPAHSTPARWALATTSLAFGLSALISTSIQQLTLYHMVLAAKFQSLPLFLSTLVEPVVPQDEGALFIVNRARWLINAIMILWYTMTAPCFGSQAVCNAYVRSHTYFAVGYVTQAQQRVTSTFNVGLITVFLLVDVIAIIWKHCPLLAMVDLVKLYRQIPHWSLLVLFGHMYWILNNAMPPLCRPRMNTPPQLLPTPATTVTRPITFLHRVRYYACMFLANVITALPYPKFQRYVAALAIAIILIWDIEQTILDNTVAAGENAWTYGQILAVLLAAVPVIQLLNLLMMKPKKARRIGKRKVE